jgi:tetratricopeptide (TPR) repeat protein
LAGTGAGGFRPSYLEDRDLNPVDPEDPHSVELLMAGELGVVGLLLFVGFFGGAVAAALRARRLGPSAGILAAGALAVGAYWLLHASVEWFWSYPAITLPATFALGAAAAPALLRPPKRGVGGRKVVVAAAAVIAAFSMIPFLLSERWTNDALGSWQGDLDGAYSQLEDAADLNPASVRPLAAEAVIAESAGDRQRALAALDRAEKRQPEEWTLYYLEARVLAPIDPAGAQRALQRAKELNPRGADVDELATQLDITL